MSALFRHVRQLAAIIARYAAILKSGSAPFPLQDLNTTLARLLYNLYKSLMSG
jgi:hypothetical protein